jgi:hypothetical protein
VGDGIEEQATPIRPWNVCGRLPGFSLFSILIAQELPMTVVQTVMRLFRASCFARARATRRAGAWHRNGKQCRHNRATQTNDCNRPHLIAPFFRGLRLAYLFFENIFWRDALPFDRGMRAEPALFRQNAVFNSDGTLYKGFPLSHVSSSVADIIP